MGTKKVENFLDIIMDALLCRPVHGVAKLTSCVVTAVPQSGEPEVDDGLDGALLPVVVGL